jgi:hypothetical protein
VVCQIVAVCNRCKRAADKAGILLRKSLCDNRTRLRNSKRENPKCAKDLSPAPRSEGLYAGTFDMYDAKRKFRLALNGVACERTLSSMNKGSSIVLALGAAVAILSSCKPSEPPAAVKDVEQPAASPATQPPAPTPAPMPPTVTPAEPPESPSKATPEATRTPAERDRSAAFEPKSPGMTAASENS